MINYRKTNRYEKDSKAIFNFDKFLKS